MIIINPTSSGGNRSLEGDVFIFQAGPLPTVKLSFTRPTFLEIKEEGWIEGVKRSRPLADVDGEEYEITRAKKRRLRLDLITSRLSRPYASPSTHIIDRGGSKIALWAKQKALGRNVLCKSAILNSMKRNAVAAKEAEQRQLETARQAASRRYQSPTSVIPRRHYIPLPPSPLGMSNYDALDLEDEFENDEASDDECPSLYSDFSVLEPSQPPDEYDTLDEPCPALEVCRLLTPPDEKVLEMMREKERQKQLSFMPMGT